jgi:hypothetical protein
VSVWKDIDTFFQKGINLAFLIKEKEKRKMLSRQSSSSSSSSLSQSLSLSLSLLSPLRLRFLVVGSCLSLIFSAFLIFGFPNNQGYYGGENGFFLKKSSSDTSCTTTTSLSSYPNNGSSYQIGKDDNWEFIANRDGDNYGLSDEQCRMAFPKLFVEIDKSVATRINANKPITWKELNSRKLADGMVRGIVDRGEVSFFIHSSLVPLFSSVGDYFYLLLD